MFAAQRNLPRRIVRNSRAAHWLALAVLAIAPAVAASPEGAEASVAEAPLQWRVAQAVAYEHGEGVPKDLLKAAALYCEAAREGRRSSALAGCMPTDVA